MNLGASGKVTQIAFLFVILVFSMVSISLSAQSSNIILSTGAISYWPQVDVAINISKVMGINNLSLGFMLDWHRWVPFVDRPVQRQLAKDANFKLIRVFDSRKISSYGYKDLMPCSYWDESTRTGTWDWTQVDSLVKAIFDVGAEPLFCLRCMQNELPPGMPVNPTTGLPAPSDYAAYAREWVRHFKAKGWPVRYYEIGNEPFVYFGWSTSPKLGYYVDLWNTCARAMRSENPNILLSQDAITQKMCLDYWLTHGDDVDYIDFHKYDAGTVGQYSDAEMFNRAETYHIESDTPNWYSILNARQKWFSARGKLLPIINSESNFNSAWETGTDPEIQQMAGAVWLALVLRMGILKGLSYNVYFEFSSSKSWQESHGTGWGFGMINEDDNHPWYPYYVHMMIGSNLAVGDKLIEVKSSSNDIRSIAWVHDGKLNILLICKVAEPRTVTLGGISRQLDVFWIDNEIPYEKPSIQTGTIISGEPWITSGYTVALLQMVLSS